MEFPHIQVMAASAGAGKTYVLSKRYIDFLLSPTINAPARSILAITFTNKAAGEMKGRIISGLKEEALGDSDQRELAEKALNELLDKFSDLRVQTIDSFLTSITISSALELGLPPHFEIVLDSSPALNFVLDELLAQVYPSSPYGKIFIRLLNELLQIDQGPGWDIKRVILENISNLRKQEFLVGERLKRVFSSEDAQKTRESLKRSIGEFLRMSKDGLNLDKRFIKAATRFIEDEKQPWESEYFLKGNVQGVCKGGSTPTPAHERIWDEIRRETSTLAEMTAHCQFAPFIDIVTLFDEGIQSFKDRQQVIFIEDLGVQLESFLSREGVVPEIYFRLGDRISHFFIDEFQDTNRIHWKDLFPLIEETLSKRGSLFYVGDKKQAIYGFRGGESILFDEAKDGFASVERRNIGEEFPDINYRSREDIVRFVNRIFSRENLTRWAETEVRGQKPEERRQKAEGRGQGAEEADFDLPLILETYHHSRQKAAQDQRGRGGLVRVERISPDEPLGKEELNVQIARRLVGLIQDDIMHRFSPGEITILVRRNDEASWVTGILTGAEIPVASEKTLQICSNHLIQEVTSFLNFLDSPIDDFSFATFISGEIFIKRAGLRREAVFSFILENRRMLRPLYVLFRERFPKVWGDHLEEYFNLVGFLPPYDLVSRIFKKYCVFENFPNEEGFFCQLLEVLKEGEAEGRNSLKAFLSLWYGSEEKPEDFQVVLPEYTDAVKVMTIHKAKGLGFPIVICPFTYLNNVPIREVYQRDGDGFIPYRIKKNLTDVSPVLRRLYWQRFTSQLIDELNAFYVALTRARDELYVFLPNFKGMSRRLHVPIFFEGPVLEVGSAIVRSPEVVVQRKRRIHPRLVNEWQDKLHRPHIYIDELVDTARKKARERGILIHNFLAQIVRLSARWSEELEGMFGSLSGNEKEIIPLMRDFFSKEQLRRWFLLPDSVGIYCEKEIVDGNGLEHRVDRLLILPEKIVVIEFKSGEPRCKEHQQQVVEYLELLSKIHPDRALEGWLIYVDEATQEKVEEDRE